MFLKFGKTWDGMPYPNVTIDDLDEHSINRFKELALKNNRLSEEDVNVDNKSLLENLRLYENGFLTISAILLFHKNPELFIDGASIKIGYFENTDSNLRYQDEINGPLILQVDKTIDLIYTKYLKALIWYDNNIRVETYMFPREAFREILLNAINHKDYSSRIPIQISVYEDKIYIANIGRFPKEINVNEIYDKHVSKPFNLKIAFSFYKTGWVESWGRGFDKIKEECYKENTPLPEVKVQGDSVMIMCLPSKKFLDLVKGEMQDISMNNLGIKLKKNEKRVLEIIMRNPKITNDVLANELKITERTITNITSKLKEMKIINRVGSKKTGYWKIL